MAKPVTYRARLRFRLQKKLGIKEGEYKFKIAGHDITLQPPQPESQIADSEWLVFNVCGLASEEAARQFGQQLRAALDISAIAARVGVDAGRDIPTSGLGAEFRQHLERQTGHILRDNIHGLDVFADAPNVRIVNFSATGVVHCPPDPLLTDLDTLFDVALNTSARSRDVILLLNGALMQPNPVAQIVFAFSAVEMLGQEQVWSDDQKRLLAQLVDAAEASVIGTANERAEVSDAILKIHRLSLRQGVMRLLDNLGLSHLRRTWDDTYGERSTLIHGLPPQPGLNYDDLAHRTVSLCGRILLKAVAVDVPAANRHVGKFYPVHQP